MIGTAGKLSCSWKPLSESYLLASAHQGYEAQDLAPCLSGCNIAAGLRVQHVDAASQLVLTFLRQLGYERLPRFCLHFESNIWVLQLRESCRKDLNRRGVSCTPCTCW